MKSGEKSQAMFKRAQAAIPCGVIVSEFLQFIGITVLFAAILLVSRME